MGSVSSCPWLTGTSQILNFMPQLLILASRVCLSLKRSDRILKKWCPCLHSLNHRPQRERERDFLSQIQWGYEGNDGVFPIVEHIKTDSQGFVGEVLRGDGKILMVRVVCVTRARDERETRLGLQRYWTLCTRGYRLHVESSFAIDVGSGRRLHVCKNQFDRLAARC